LTDILCFISAHLLTNHVKVFTLRSTDNCSFSQRKTSGW